MHPEQKEMRTANRRVFTCKVSFVSTKGIQYAGGREAEKRRVHACRILPRDTGGAGCGLAGSESEEATARAGEGAASIAQSSTQQRLTVCIPSRVLL